MLYSEKIDIGTCLLDDLTLSTQDYMCNIFVWQLYIEVSHLKIKAVIWT